MLLPQSSAFAALKNRLNSVSAIGYLHIAPRVYVASLKIPSYTQSRKITIVQSISTFKCHQSKISLTDTHASAYSPPATAAPSSYDRPNRLKGRDEGIRWTELLEKFKNVQDKARRAQRPGGDFDDGIDFGTRAIDPSDSRAFKDLARVHPTPSTLLKDSAAAPAVAQAQVQKSKSGLGKFGRLGGAVSGSRPKR